jgi:hypothetical protein
MFRKNDSNSLYGTVDERTKAVVYQGDAYTGRFMLFAVLIDVVVRGLKLIEPVTATNFDLLAIVILGGLVSTVYQFKNKILFNKPNGKSLLFVLLIMAVSAILAIIFANIL